MSKSRTTLLLLGMVVLAAVWWGPGLVSGDTTTSPAAVSVTTDADSGLPWIDAADLPPEAADTLALVDSGGPFPYDEDGDVFRNLERILPEEDYGYYHEYTVDTPGSSDRGARRIVTGSDGQLYWTEDHYQSFERIHR
ncbi:MAG: ribonuclease domain-containing protein [Nocardioidaceae bacterium]